MVRNCPNCSALLQYLICIREESWKEYCDNSEPIILPQGYYKLTWKCPICSDIIAENGDGGYGKEWLVQ